MKILTKKQFVTGLCAGLLFSAVFPTIISAETVKKGKYTLNLFSEQKKKGNYQILEISGDITGPKCESMKLNVSFENKYANRGQKIFILENIEDNAPLPFLDYDEIFPTKNDTTWKVDEVYVDCRD
ncbi:MAG: hypothetical protein H8E41_08535 [Desulfobulbaceae bacterium]|uniref:Uncharacterized protein n=1 Tax=Candidatus Desulfobia pelagia TaxID=2841692 RepID=A0A8J6NC85_9BACT|nr:hypothetical protein [Candidatus Desulfobia pelagia]